MFSGIVQCIKNKETEMVYDLIFFYWDDDPANDDYVIVAVYSSYELAEKGREKFAVQPRFKGKKEAFNIIEHKINEENSTWSDGFVTLDLTYFRIDLLGKYRINKYEGEEIGIYDEGEQQELFVKKINDYQDYAECTILRNREKMYCFDKNKRTIVIETENEDNLILSKIKKGFCRDFRSGDLWMYDILL